MTTRSSQKLSSKLAVFSIVALLLLLVFVWTAVRNGVFSSVNDINTHGSYRLRPIDSSSDSTTTSIPIEHSTHHHSHGHHSHHHHHHHHQHNESTISPGKFTPNLQSFLIIDILY